MNRAHFYLALFILIPTLLFLLMPFNIGDLSIWVALGRDSLAHFEILRQDPYTVAQTSEMIYPAPLCWLYGFLYQLQGLPLLTLLHALVPACWVLIWWRFLQRKFPQDVTAEKDFWHAPTIATFALALLGCSMLFVARPALVATLPLLASYCLLVKTRHRPMTSKEIFILLSLEVLWANIHGSFILLPVMVLWQSFSPVGSGDRRSVRQRFLLTGGLLLGALMNPFGWKIYPATLQTYLLSKQQAFTEWLPPQHFDFPVASVLFWLFSGLLLIGFWHFYRSKEKPLRSLIFDPMILLWISGFFAIRNTAFCFLVLPVFIYGSCELPLPTSSKNSSSNRVLNGGLIGMLLFLCLALSPFLKERWSALLPHEFQDRFSLQAHIPEIDAYLATHPGLIFNDRLFGSDLALQQPNKYLIDIRNQIFTQQWDQQYDAFVAQPSESSPLLQLFHFHYFLVDEKHRALVVWLKTSGRFHVVMTEGPALLFEAGRD